MSEEERVGVFFVAWLLLGTATWAYLRSASVAEKRYWLPRFHIGFGIALVGFSFWVIPDIGALVFAGIGTVLVTVLNFRATRICPSCGLVQQNTDPFSEMRFCKSCGADISNARMRL